MHKVSKNCTPTYLSQIINLFQKILFLKVFYSKAMLFSIALYQRNIYIDILYVDSNQRKLYVHMKTLVDFVYILNNQSHCTYSQIFSMILRIYFEVSNHWEKIVSLNILF